MIRFTTNGSAYLVFQQYYPHSLTWYNASDLCKKHGYQLWNVGSSDEWSTVFHALRYFMLGFEAIPIDLQCDGLQLSDAVCVK